MGLAYIYIHHVILSCHSCSLYRYIHLKFTILKVKVNSSMDSSPQLGIYYLSFRCQFQLLAVMLFIAEL